MLAIHFILFGLAGFLSTTSFSTSVSVNLPEPKIIDLGYGYILGQEAVPQVTAKALCDFAGKEIVSIESVEEDVLIVTLLRNASFTSHVWTSGTNQNQIPNMSLWRWGNGAPMFHTRWFSGHPRRDAIYCHALNSDRYDRVWTTHDCAENHYPLCENKKKVA